MVRRWPRWFSWEKPTIDGSWKDNEIARLKLELEAMERARSRVIPVIEVGLGDPEPATPELRKQYVADFVRFYDDHFDKKLRHMIATVREDLDWAGWLDERYRLEKMPQGTTRAEYDSYLRGTSNAFRLLLEYGELMRAEHTMNINNENK